jgi:DNA mismatch repair protein MutS2
MNEKTIELLEFDVIRGRVADCARSDEARQLILAEMPFTDRKNVDLTKQNAAAIAGRITSGDAEPQGRLPSIGGLLPVLGVEGAAFSIEEAFDIGCFVREGSAVLRWLGDMDVANGAPDCSAVEKTVFRVLDKDGKLRDLPELREIRMRIVSLNRELQIICASYTRNAALRRMLQSDVPTQRDGRLVIALKHQFRGRIRGIVHEVSTTGQTLFIEPEDVVEKNNEIFVEQRRYDAEVRRILREMTADIASVKDELLLFYERVVFIETLRARARYSVNTGGIFLPTDNGGQTCAFTLKQARHPLLGGKAVPIDIEMKERVLVISGPNTGGKTAALKTAGLFALMNQAGLALPLAEGSALPVFGSIFAGIGDDQSLEHSLSTFSAHISVIASILDSANAESLVLLDELCAGTDPAEGGAIAMAILDNIIEKDCFCIVTTHHGALKNYAFSNSRVENSSVEFDTAAMKPAYRIVMGLPGESHAFDISRRCGLSVGVVERARRYLDEGCGDVSALITALTEKNRAAGDVLRELQTERQCLQEERRGSALRERCLRQNEAELASGSLGSLRSLLDESRKTLENLVCELREGEITREKTLKVKNFLSCLEESVEREAENFESMKADIADMERPVGGETEDSHTVPIDGEIRPGLAVLAGAKRLPGVIRRQAKKGFWVVEVGSVSMTFPENGLSTANPQTKPSKPKTASVDYSLSAPSAALELNLRGMHLNDALEMLQRHIDSAIILGMWNFAVIHGKGDGILQHGVHDYLSAQSTVASFHFSTPELGGFGRTEVALKH